MKSGQEWWENVNKKQENVPKLQTKNRLVMSSVNERGDYEDAI